MSTKKTIFLTAILVIATLMIFIAAALQPIKAKLTENSAMLTENSAMLKYLVGTHSEQMMTWEQLPFDCYYFGAFVDEDSTAVIIPFHGFPLLVSDVPKVLIEENGVIWKQRPMSP